MRLAAAALALAVAGCAPAPEPAKRIRKLPCLYCGDDSSMSDREAAHVRMLAIGALLALDHLPASAAVRTVLAASMQAARLALCAASGWDARCTAMAWQITRSS